MHPETCQDFFARSREKPSANTAVGAAPHGLTPCDRIARRARPPARARRIGATSERRDSAEPKTVPQRFQSGGGAGFVPGSHSTSGPNRCPPGARPTPSRRHHREDSRGGTVFRAAKRERRTGALAPVSQCAALTPPQKTSRRLTRCTEWALTSQPLFGIYWRGLAKRNFQPNILAPWKGRLAPSTPWGRAVTSATATGWGAMAGQGRSGAR